jgi:hypothetical protein
MDVTVVHLQLIHLIALYVDFIVIVPDSNLSHTAVHQWVLWLLFFFPQIINSLLYVKNFLLRSFTFVGRSPSVFYCINIVNIVPFNHINVGLL